MIDPLDTELQRLDLGRVRLEVARQKLHGKLPLAEGGGDECHRPHEAEVTRPLRHRLFEHAARLGHAPLAHQRVGQPHVDLGKIGAVDERRLPRTGRLVVAPRRGKHRGEIGEHRGVLAVGVEGRLEACLGLHEFASGEGGRTGVECRAGARGDSLAERLERVADKQAGPVEGTRHHRVEHRQEHVGGREHRTAVGGRHQHRRGCHFECPRVGLHHATLAQHLRAEVVLAGWQLAHGQRLREDRVRAARTGARLHRLRQQRLAALRLRQLERGLQAGRPLAEHLDVALHGTEHHGVADGWLQQILGAVERPPDHQVAETQRARLDHAGAELVLHRTDAVPFVHRQLQRVVAGRDIHRARELQCRRHAVHHRRQSCLTDAAVDHAPLAVQDRVADRGHARRGVVGADVGMHQHGQLANFLLGQRERGDAQRQRRDRQRRVHRRGDQLARALRCASVDVAHQGAARADGQPLARHVDAHRVRLAVAIGRARLDAEQVVAGQL